MKHHFFKPQCIFGRLIYSMIEGTECADVCCYVCICVCVCVCMSTKYGWKSMTVFSIFSKMCLWYLLTIFIRWWSTNFIVLIFCAFVAVYGLKIQQDFDFYSSVHAKLSRLYLDINTNVPCNPSQNLIVFVVNMSTMFLCWHSRKILHISGNEFQNILRCYGDTDALFNVFEQYFFL